MTDTTVAEATTNPNETLAAVENYVIRVNGKEVWRSEGRAMLVDKVTFNNSRGEVTVIGSANQDKYLDIVVNERSFDDPATYLDMIEDEKMQERRKRFEPAPDTSREGYVKADPETGAPMVEETASTSQESIPVGVSTETQTQAEAAGDVEF